MPQEQEIETTRGEGGKHSNKARGLEDNFEEKNRIIGVKGEKDT